MPEEEKKARVSELKKRFRNFVLYNLRRAGLGKWHEVDVEAAPQIELELKEEGLLVEFQSKIQLLEKLEAMWKNMEEKKEEIMELYEKVGFLNNPSMTMKESGTCKRGTNLPLKDNMDLNQQRLFEEEFQKIRERSKLLEQKGGQPFYNPQSFEPFRGEIEKLKDGRNYWSEWVPFKTEVDGQEVIEYYPLPIAVPFRFWSSLLNDRDSLTTEYLQGYFGFLNIESVWEPAYKEFFNEIINEAETKVRCDNEGQRQNVKENITTLKVVYGEAIHRILTEHIRPRENEIFGVVKTISEVASEIETFRNELTQRIPQSLNIKIHFRRTFLIIDPSKIEWPCSGEPANIQERFKWKYGDYADDINRIKRFMKREDKFTINDFSPAELRDGETIPGLDENGWPLEIADRGYEFEGNFIEEGTVLKDVFNHPENPPRRVDMKWVVPMDPLLMANVIYVEWDAVRDDIRDGRYHPDSLTVVDYLMAETPSLFRDLKGEPEWRNMSESKIQGPKEEEFRSYTMHYLNENLNVDEIKKGKRKPSNLIPAFDKRAIGEPFVHLGRKFYYQTARSILELTNRDLEREEVKLAIGSHISTRGISQYIIMKILLHMKYFNEAKNRLDLIAAKQGVWYDYGPRNMGEPGSPPLGPWK